ncbi:1,6-anhydro-N-acetylmuramyl-L-alanine amidase AmpD [Crenothrix polyspora]|uniref:1,6-anhydro-N-acetylmuramyl-L-alanine amidase AmpD n=1 Tax=Crenothrix polyspora TaxID=360316 RepID=A0A1R4H6K3_9GAMM|nr:1,6-anhydro-N-acetylmuramyl-L-alanine amidase AmpD [Crenothrix polyspora]SJM91908.1 N-acetyl-anhydromuranmyl-L-alanine amidase [Crenothrix polyspora]
MHINQHWLNPATRHPSPNFDERIALSDISLIVIHCISLPPGEFATAYIDHLFCNQLDPDAHPYFTDICQLTVSAHVLIKRTGEIVQYVPFDKRAWHAGKSEYQGRERCNDFSVGIELEGTEYIAYTDEQYSQLAEIIKVLLATYPNLSQQHITGHSNIAPGRKTDPGDSFNWSRFFESLS